MSEERNRLLVELLVVFEKDARCLNRKRTVDDDRDVVVETSLLPQIVEVIEERLCPPDGKGRYDDVAAPIHRVADDLKECRLLVIVAMNAVAIGGLDNEEVRPRDLLRVAQDRLMRLSKIARKDQFGLLHPLTHHDLENRRTEDMPRITECHSDIPQIHRLLIGYRRKVFQCRKDICLCVERRDRFLAAPCILAVQHLRVALLDMRRVRQHDAHEVTGGTRGVDVAHEALTHETRNPPAVIDVRVGQKNRVDLSRVEREWLIVHLA